MKKQLELFAFLERLDARKVWYRLERVRDETIMVVAAVPGERWEVEFFANGDLEIECFRSTGRLTGPESIEDLFRLAD